MTETAAEATARRNLDAWESRTGGQMAIDAYRDAIIAHAALSELDTSGPGVIE